MKEPYGQQDQPRSLLEGAREPQGGLGGVLGEGMIGGKGGDVGGGVCGGEGQRPLKKDIILN